MLATRGLLAGVAALLCLASAERADRSETIALVADWHARGRVAAAPAAAKPKAVAAKVNSTAGGVDAFPYKAIGEFLGDDSSGLVIEANNFATHVEGELTKKADETVGKSDEYAELLKRQDAGNDLVVAAIHDFKASMGLHEKEKLKGVVSELNEDITAGGAGAGGAGAGDIKTEMMPAMQKTASVKSVAAAEIKAEEIPPTQKMASAGVEDFLAAEIGLQAIGFKEGTGDLDDASQARINHEFVEPLRVAKGKAKSSSKFLFCIYYSTTVGADQVKQGLMKKRGDNLESIVTKHADQVLGSGNYKIGGKFEGYDSSRLGAIVYKILANGQDAPCTPKDAEIAETGTAQ